MLTNSLDFGIGGDDDINEENDNYDDDSVHVDNVRCHHLEIVLYERKHHDCAVASIQLKVLVVKLPLPCAAVHEDDQR